MTSELRLAAIEHLLAALLTEASRSGVNIVAVNSRATSSLLSSDGPDGPIQKSQAIEALGEIMQLQGAREI
ncbi:hypothetical protein [Pseudomonas akapageensis]|uniref:hypothetical protein n=1 Tax=Pseudomonas akapageensis TaxID=2609961 RepID=UPI001409C1CF|nr:hypothetical protein [Pseudomonas akapageensis]